jgi:hypothetical protein
MRGGERYIVPCSLIASTVTMGEDREGGGKQRTASNIDNKINLFILSSFFEERCFEGGVLGCSAMLSVFLFVCGGYVMAI